MRATSPRRDRAAQRRRKLDAPPSPVQDGRCLRCTLDQLIDSPTAATSRSPVGITPSFSEAAWRPRATPRRKRSERVRIYGPLEARLQTVDRIVLGGLNEGSWPPDTRSDPWLSRPMRRDLGLDPPSAASASPRTTSRRRSARQKSSSRARPRGRRADRHLALPATHRRARRRTLERRRRAWRTISRACPRARCARRGSARQRPEPHPHPKSARSNCRSPTSRTGCAIPTRSTPSMCCDLRPLEAVDTPPGAADRGTVIHEAIGDYTETVRRPLAGRCRAGTDSRSAKSISRRSRTIRRRARSGGRASSASRDWFAGWERERRQELDHASREIRGENIHSARRAELHLAARADRIEQRAGRQLRHPRLQDRPAADRDASAHRVGAAIDAGSRHPARRRFPRILPPARWSKSVMCGSRAASRPASPRTSSYGKGAHPTARPTSRWQKLTGIAISFSSTASPIARWCTRCGRSTTAITTISRASRNGRSPAARRRGADP